MIEHWNAEEDGELSKANMSAKLVKLGYQVNCYTYPPGTYFPEHAHEVDKIDGVLSGQFMMTMQGQSFVLSAGDWLKVPCGVIHNAEVLGSEPVISLDAVKI